MRNRHEFCRRLSGPVQVHGDPERLGLTIHPPKPADTERLGALMVDAYAGTMDYEGEGLEQGVGEVKGWFNGAVGAAIPECSAVAWARGDPVAACLVSWWILRECPFIAYVFTQAVAKRRGVGRLVLEHSLRALEGSGHREVRAVVTLGNTPSEALFSGAGFEDLGPLAHTPGT